MHPNNISIVYMELQATWRENVILVDAAYIDRVVFDLSVNFERMLERRIPKADFARWIDCVALDGGLRPLKEGEERETLVILLYPKKKKTLENFLPSNLEKDLNGKSFKDNLGEFTCYTYPMEDLVPAEEFFLESLQVIADEKTVKNLLVIPDCEKYGADVRSVLKMVKEKQATLFSMQPQLPGPYKQEILGYSLMNALGIRGEEFNRG